MRSNRLGGNSLSDLLVFGRRAGLGAADYVRALVEPAKDLDSAVEKSAGDRADPVQRSAGRCRRTLHPAAELQQTMNDLVGIIRTGEEMQQAWIGSRSTRSATATSSPTAAASSTRAGTWPWTCATCCWSASASPGPHLARTEAVGGHTRDDFPKMDADWRQRWWCAPGR